MEWATPWNMDHGIAPRTMGSSIVHTSLQLIINCPTHTQEKDEHTQSERREGDHACMYHVSSDHDAWSQCTHARTFPILRGGVMGHSPRSVSDVSCVNTNKEERASEIRQRRGRNMESLWSEQLSGILATESPPHHELPSRWAHIGTKDEHALVS